MRQPRISLRIAFALGSLLLAAMLIPVSSTPSIAQGVPVSEGKPLDIKVKFKTIDTKKRKPRGVSGVACLPQVGKGRACLTVNDEERYAEWAILSDTRLKPTGILVQVLPKDPQMPYDIVGQKPSIACETEVAGELDGEAIARAGHTIYVIGSHSCSRKGDEFRISSFVLARTNASAKAIGPEGIERTWRVSDLITGTWGKDANKAGIEGMAVIDRRIYLGFRTPIDNGKATILATEVEPLFAKGPQPGTAKPLSIPLSLGEKNGIRDLVALDASHLLVLAGPAAKTDGTYVIYVLDVGASLKPESIGKLQPLVELGSFNVPDKEARAEKNAKGNEMQQAAAEAITVLSRDNHGVTVLVLYDNADETAPRVHRIELPKM